MTINPIQAQFNKPQNYFINKPVNNVQNNIKPADKQPEKVKSPNNKIYWGLGTLALLIIAGLSYKKFHKNIVPKENPISNAGTIIKEKIYSAKNSVENFLKNLSDIKKNKIDNKLKDLNFEEFNITDCLKKEPENIAPFKYFAAAKKAELGEFPELPGVLVFNNVPKSKLKDISKIFSKLFDSNFSHTKYTKGYESEFLSSLEEFSSNAAKRFNEDKTNSFLYFDNMSEFLEVIKKPENENLKSNFENLIKKNSKNKITYIVDKDAAGQLDSNLQHSINYDEEINNLDLTKDLEEREFQLDSKFLPYSDKITKGLSELMYSNLDNTYWIRDLMFDKTTKNIILAEGQDKTALEKVMNIISSKTGNVFAQIDCSISLKELLPNITKKLEQNEEFYNRTGKRTFLHLDNLEKLISSDLNENSPGFNTLKQFIKDSEQKYHTVMVINKNNLSTNLEKLVGKDNKIFNIRLFANGEKAFNDSWNLMQDRMIKNDFSHIDSERFKREFINFIASERAGQLKDSRIIKNGILLHGSEDVTRITADAIKNTVDANYVKISFNKEKPSDVIDEMINKAQEAEKLFEETRKRTILEVDNLDELLTKWKDNEANMELINEFKSFTEDISKNYHTTILMRTNKTLNEFESASIASHRLGMHIEVR